MGIVIGQLGRSVNPLWNEVIGIADLNPHSFDMLAPDHKKHT